MRVASRREAICIENLPAAMSHNTTYASPPDFHFRFRRGRFPFWKRPFARHPARKPAFLPALIPLAMRHDREIEYIPLDLFGQEPNKKRGFLMWLLDAVFEWCTVYKNHGQASSSGGEVEEKTIEF